MSRLPLSALAVTAALVGLALPTYAAPSSLVGGSALGNMAANGFVQLAQAPSVTTEQGSHPRGPHADNQPDGSPTPHIERNNESRVEGGGPPAHLHTRGGEVETHRPGAAGSRSPGAPAHLDNQAGDSPTPHAPGRGAPR